MDDRGFRFEKVFIHFFETFFKSIKSIIIRMNGFVAQW